MVKLFTRKEALQAGISDRRLERGVEAGRYIRLAQGVYFQGDRDPVVFERRLALAIRSGKPVSGELAARLHGMDGFKAPSDGDYTNVVRDSVHQTLLKLGATTDDLRWEQALEWSLRNGNTSIAAIEDELTRHRRGNGRIRRVLDLRPNAAPPTGSILETYAIQLIRKDAALSEPHRQVEVLRALGRRPAYVDLAWPEQGVFLELDGERHKGQPRYDASRQTAVIAATGWLVGRFTWSDVVHHPTSTLRQIARLLSIHAAA